MVIGHVRFALASLECVTPAQLEAVKRLARNHSEVYVGPGTFDLPRGYVTFRQDNRIYGGISPEGDVST